MRVNYDKIMEARWNFDASSARTRRVSVLGKHQNRSESALFCYNSWTQSKYTVINLIHTRLKETFCLFLNVIIRHFTVWSVIKYCQQNIDTLVANEFTLRDATISTARGVRSYAECNWTKIMHERYFCVSWVSSIQIGCSMRVVYAECMNKCRGVEFLTFLDSKCTFGKLATGVHQLLKPCSKHY